MKIAILGFGNIGQALYRASVEDARRAEAVLGERIEVVRILVRNAKKPRAVEAPGLLTEDFEEILASDAEAIVELTSDGTRAIDYMKRSMEAGKHVVTANKAALATAFAELQKTAREHGVHLRFEAAVCGGIPLISPLSRLLAFNEITRIRGIVNGSTNYVLTELSEGRELKPVLEEASAIGILEEDPSEDLSGRDARRKIAILGMMATGRFIDETRVPCLGIENIDEFDTRVLRERGYRVKLTAQFLRGSRYGLGEDEFSVQVFPAAWQNDPIRFVDGVMNTVDIEGSMVGELRLNGSGGGGNPTADAVLCDLFEVRAMRPQYFEVAENGLSDVSGDAIGIFYVRFADGKPEDAVDRELQAHAAELISGGGHCVITHPIPARKALEYAALGAHVIRMGD